jgi:hypothetical protein
MTSTIPTTDTLDNILHAVALDRAADRETALSETRIIERVAAQVADSLATVRFGDVTERRLVIPDPIRPKTVSGRIRRWLFGPRLVEIPLPPLRRDGGMRTVVLGREKTTHRTREWFAAYHEQATHELLADATRYAADRARQIARLGGRGDDDYVSDLVQGVFADTFDGTLVWHPQVPLKVHVFHTIKSRSRHDRERALQYPHVSLDGSNGQRRAALDAIEHEAVQVAAASSRDCDDDMQRFAEDSINALRTCAMQHGDRDVLALLEVYALNLVEKREVLELTRMSERRYRNARRRLVGYVDQLPSALREARRAYV